MYVIFKGLLLAVHFFFACAPMIVFAILYVDICTKLQSIIMLKVANIKNSPNCLSDCDHFFMNELRGTNQLFSPFLFLIIPPYMIVITFGSYLALFSLADFMDMSLMEVMFGLSQIFVTLYFVLIVFVINHYSNKVTSAFQEYKVRLRKNI